LCLGRVLIERGWSQRHIGCPKNGTHGYRRSGV
jgi:hypothetical protein